MKLKKAFLATSIALLSAGSAQAGFVVENWDLNTGAAGVGQGLTTSVTGIDEMSFLAVSKAVKGADVGPVGLVGDTYTVTVFGNITAMTNYVAPPVAIGSITPAGLNQNVGSGICGIVNCFELTFALTTTVTVNSVDISGNVGFTHNIGAGSTLRFYIDNLADGVGAQASSANAASYTDGTLVFSADDAGGPQSAGNFNTVNGDGNDDGYFLVNAGNAAVNVAGVFTKGAYDFGKTVGSDVETDSNFHFGGFPSFGALAPCGNSAIDFCATEDGSTTLSQVPEPATVGLAGIALVGLGLVRRRRRNV